jgi:hypothetical protein
MQTVVVRDKNFHDVEGQDFPRVTHILDVGYPKGEFFYEWLKKNGDASDELRDAAGDSGTLVHHAIGELLNGAEFLFGNYFAFEKDGRHLSKIPTGAEWEKLVAFCRWYHEFKPDKVLHVEKFLVSRKYHFSGSADFIVEKDGKTYLLDFKTGKGMHMHFWAQLAAYAIAFEEMGLGKIDALGIIHLGTMHKAKYNYVERDDIQKCFDVFKAARTIYLWETMGKDGEPATPKHREYQSVLSLAAPVVDQEKPKKTKTKKLKIK